MTQTALNIGTTITDTQNDTEKKDAPETAKPSSEKSPEQLE
ncbi:hypothetical protein [Okeania sp. SIO2B3]|nr:hypothetical protein [Okeania sp. SIO2B3]